MHKTLQWAAFTLLVVLSIIYCRQPEVRGQTEGFNALGQQVVRLIRGNFYDSERANAWASRHADYGAQAHSVVGFAKLTKEILSELRTSHTGFYTPLEPEYYGLLSIFQKVLGVEATEVESIGVDFDDEHFVRVVFAGGPGDKAGLHRGDKVLMADGKEFDPVGSFLRKAGQPVVLTIERKQGESWIQIRVTPRKIDPQKEWLEAQLSGSRVIERVGKRIAYVPMFSCTGEEYVTALQNSIADKFRDSSTLILDFRDGWGGCSPDFLNLFSPVTPILTYIDRNGMKKTVDRQWRKSLYVLINERSRSGKEEVAFAMKKHRLGTLIGEKTAGAVMGGRCFLLPGKLLLYVADLNVLVDGRRLEGQGVSPDVEVKASLSYADGFDPQLEKALELATK